MRVVCHLRDARGDRSLRQIAEAANLQGLTSGLLSLMEQGRLLPTDEQAVAIERAYGQPITALYSPLALLAAQED